MSHSFSTEIQGNSYDLNAVQKELKHTHERMINHYMEHTEQTKNVIETHLVGTQDRWLTPDDVIKFGIADEIKMIELPD
jgi:ATP-dependent protease ClpP protease subunit